MGADPSAPRHSAIAAPRPARTPTADILSRPTAGGTRLSPCGRWRCAHPSPGAPRPIPPRSAGGKAPTPREFGTGRSKNAAPETQSPGSGRTRKCGVNQAPHRGIRGRDFKWKSRANSLATAHPAGERNALALAKRVDIADTASSAWRFCSVESVETSCIDRSRARHGSSGHFFSAASARAAVTQPLASSPAAG